MGWQDDPIIDAGYDAPQPGNLATMDAPAPVAPAAPRASSWQNDPVIAPPPQVNNLAQMPQQLEQQDQAMQQRVGAFVQPQQPLPPSTVAYQQPPTDPYNAAAGYPTMANPMADPQYFAAASRLGGYEPQVNNLAPVQEQQQYQDLENAGISRRAQAQKAIRDWFDYRSRPEQLGDQQGPSIEENIGAQGNVARLNAANQSYPFPTDELRYLDPTEARVYAQRLQALNSGAIQQAGRNAPDLNIGPNLAARAASSFAGLAPIVARGKLALGSFAHDTLGVDNTRFMDQAYKEFHQAENVAARARQEQEYIGQQLPQTPTGELLTGQADLAIKMAAAAATRNPQLATAMFSGLFAADAAGQAYQSARQRGGSDQEATQDATFSGIKAAIIARLPMAWPALARESAAVQMAGAYLSGTAITTGDAAADEAWKSLVRGEKFDQQSLERIGMAMLQGGAPAALLHGAHAGMQRKPVVTPDTGSFPIGDQQRAQSAPNRDVNYQPGPANDYPAVDRRGMNYLPMAQADQQQASRNFVGGAPLNLEGGVLREGQGQVNRTERAGVQTPQGDEQRQEMQYRTQPKPVRSPDELSNMNGRQLASEAARWGVTFDAPSTTIPRILDAQARWRLEQLSDKQLWDTVREQGLRAGNRQTNIDTLLGQASESNAGASIRPTPTDTSRAPIVQEQAAGEGENQPQTLPEGEQGANEPWVAADAAIKDYVDNLPNLSDKQLKIEEKRAAHELNQWARNTPPFLPDGKTLNPEVLGTQGYFEVSNKFRDINRELERRRANENNTPTNGESGAVSAAPAVNPSPSDSATGKATAPKTTKPYSRADVERRLLDWHRTSPDVVASGEQGYQEHAATEESGGGAGVFQGKVPDEVTNLLTKPERIAARKLGILRLAKAGEHSGGPDALDRLGDDGYAAMIKRQLANRQGRDAAIGAAKEAARGSDDPAVQFMAAVHDALTGPANERTAYSAKAPGEIPTGSKFEFQGEPFRVVEDPQSGMRVLKDDGHYPEVPIDFLDKVPVDKGTLEQGKASEPAAEPAYTYFNGDRAEYTGNTKTIGKETYYEIRMLEGANKGKLMVDSSPPSNPNATRDANAARLQQEFKDQQEQARKLKEPAKPEPPKAIADGIATAGGKVGLFGQPDFDAKAGGQEMFGFRQVSDAVKREAARTYSDEIERKEISAPTGDTAEEAAVRARNENDPNQLKLGEGEDDAPYKPAPGDDIPFDKKPGATDTPEFKRWFGESKIVDDAGKPLVVYHGTKSAFEGFDAKHFGASDEGLAGKGFYFTYNPEEASGYALNQQYGKGDAPNVRPVYVSIKNPLVITHGVLPDGRKIQELHKFGINSGGGNAVRKIAEDGGHDGILFTSRDGEVRHVVAWRPEQIKSATGNRGTFDPDNPNILYEGRRPSRKTPASETAREPLRGKDEPPPAEIRRQIADALFGENSFIGSDVKPGIEAGATAIKEAATQLQRALAPQTRGTEARLAKGAIREFNAELAQKKNQAMEATAKARWHFEGEKKKVNYDFIDRMEHGAKQDTPELTQFAGVLRKLLDEGRADVQRLGTGKLQHFIENYFPHMWKDPDGAKSMIGRVLGKRPLEGTKSFLKKRSIENFTDGIKAGLEPVTDNPVDLVLLKYNEMQRYVFAHKVLSDLKAQNVLPYVPANQKPAEGLVKINDPVATVYGKPTVTVKEYVDTVVYEGLSQLADDLGIKHDRLINAGRGALGFSVQGGNQVVSQFGTGEATFAHEIGHQLDVKYGMGERFFNPTDRAKGQGYLPGVDPETGVKDKNVRATFRRELRALADLKTATWDNPAGEKDPYHRARAEQLAHIMEAYIHARERFHEVAPNVYNEFERMVYQFPELSRIPEIQNSISKMEIENEMPHGGMLIMGSYYAPEAAATVLNNHLSPGLRNKSGAMRAFMGAANFYNAVQLGLSAFHLGMTSIDASTSKLALAFQKVAAGQPLAAAATAAQAPIAPLQNMLRGRQVLHAWLGDSYAPSKVAQFAGKYLLDPLSKVTGANLDAQTLGKIVDSVIAGGGRAKMDDFYRTAWADKMLSAFRKGNILGGAWRAPFAAFEQAAKPILEYIVPRQKLGVFADMARHELEQLPPDATRADVREVMGNAWDSVDNRLGQVVYDNLFWNRTAKDLAMLGVRSVGWNLGTFRELGGGMIDAAKFAGKAAALGKLGKPEFTRRMAYTAAMPLVAGAVGASLQYLLTGKGPTQLLDYFYPKTGKQDADGNEQRLSLPSYMRDVVAYSRHPLETLKHKVHPSLDLIVSMLENKDFYGTKIVNEEDPLMKRLIDRAKFTGKSLTPFGVQGYQKLSDEDLPGARKILPFVGFPPAPSSLTQTPAQEMAREILGGKGMEEGRTQAQADKAKLKRDLANAIREHKPDAQANLNKAMKDKKISPDEMTAINGSAQLEKLPRMMHNFSADETRRVWNKALQSGDENDIRQVKGTFLLKIANAEHLSPDQKRAWKAAVKGNQRVEPLPAAD